MTDHLPKVAFLFKEGRKNKVRNDVGSYPTEFFYGYAQLKATNEGVSLIEEQDLLGSQSPNFVWRLINHLTYGGFGLNAWALKAIFTTQSRAMLNQFDVIITTSNIFAVVLGAAQHFGLLKPQVVSFVMGVITPDMPFWRRQSILWALKGTRILTISKGEQAYLQKLGRGRINCHYLPFGVDAEFWTPLASMHDSHELTEPYVLSIGNDRFRDYQTLVASWKPHFPLLKIITKLPVDHAAQNIEVIEGDMWKQTFSDAEIRSLMQKALFVVIPLHKTIQPSGQSATLQAMACGKTVVLSNIEGLWDRSLMVNEESCWLVEPESVDDLTSAVSRLLEHTMKTKDIGIHARTVVTQHLNTEILANSLRDHLAQVVKNEK